LAGGGDRPLPTRLGVQGRRAKAAAGEGSAQRPPAVSQRSRGRIEAAEPLGQGKGVFGLCAVGEEVAGLPAHPWLEQSLTIAGPIASAAYKTAVGGASAMLASP
jgi:hypothetical protein